MVQTAFADKRGSGKAGNGESRIGHTPGVQRSHLTIQAAVGNGLFLSILFLQQCPYPVVERQQQCDHRIAFRYLRRVGGGKLLSVA